MSDKPVVFDDDNPEWTAEDFARAQPASELPPHVLAAFPKTKNKGGRPRGSTKEQIALRVDQDVLDRYRASGPGWQTKMAEALRRAAP